MDYRFFPLLLLCCAGRAQGPSPKIFEVDSLGRTLNVRSEHPFGVSLPSYVSSGYTWALLTGPEAAPAVILDSTTYQPPPHNSARPPMLNAPGRRDLFFLRIDTPGRYTLPLLLRRPWASAPPGDTLLITVLVE